MKFLNNLNPRSLVVVDFTTSTGESRKLYWDNDYRTLSIEMDNGVILQHGQELYQPLVINRSSSVIPNGSVVMYDGAVGELGKMKVKLAIGNGTISADQIMGIATETLAIGASGYVTMFGNIRAINTSGSTAGETWVDGEILYLSPTIPGGLTKIKPSAPNLKIQVARVVTAHATMGTLAVGLGFGSELGGTDSNVQITAVSDKDLLIYDGATQIWKNAKIPNATSTVVGLVKLFSDTVQSVAATAVSTTASRTYGIQVNSSGQLVVNVPWVDTNTTYTASNGVVLSGTDFQHVDTSSQATVTNTGRTYIQSITLDTYGHITALTSATETVTDTNTASAVDNILDGSNSGTAITYAPYTTQQAKLSFDTSTTAPTRTDRLNLNGYLYATKLYSGGTEVSVNGHNHGTYDNSTALTGANVYSNISITDGIVTGLTTRALTPADIGALASGANASTASKWLSAIALSLTGDVTGTANIDGSGNVSITTTVGDDSHTHDTRYYTESEINNSGIPMRFSYINANGVPSTNLGSPTLAEMALFPEQFNNKSEFYDITKLSFQTSSDRVTWLDFPVSDSIKANFLGGDSGTVVAIPHGTVYFRIALRATSYVYLNALYMYWSGIGNSTKVKVYKKHDSGSYTQHTSSDVLISSWPGHMYLPFSTIPFTPGGTLGTHYDEVYFEFQPTWSHATNPISLYKFQLWGGFPAGRRNLFYTDAYRNATFPANITATTFIGALSGNASTATSAGKWTTARTITLGGDLTGNVSIDGSANVTLTATIGANSVALGTDTTGNYVAGLTQGTGISISGTAAEGWSPTVALSHLGIQSLTNPGADRIMFWDDSAGAMAWLTLGTNLSITGTTINAVGTTYSAGTSTVLGLAKLFSDTQQSIVANAVSATANRTYGIQVNSSGQLVVNVPWADTNTTYVAATTTTLGIVKVFSDTDQSVVANAVTTTANRTYGVQLNSSDQMVVNVPWTDTNTASAVDNLLDGSNDGTAITYAPYAAQQTKLSFDTSITTPTRSDRLNLNGYLYATKIFAGDKEVATVQIVRW